MRRHILDDQERLDFIENFRFATRGAYALGRAKKPKDAIVLLERASDLVASSNQQRWDLKRLEADYPDMHARLQEAWSLQRASHERDGLDAFGNMSVAERSAQASVDQIVGEIRKIPGFNSFALPSNWKDVDEASIETPLAYLVATDKGSAAFVVIPGSGSQRKIVLINDVAVTLQDIAKAVRRRRWQSACGTGRYSRIAHTHCVAGKNGLE